MRLSEKFEDYQVCHATGIEKDILQCCMDFCMKHVPEFDKTWVYEEIIGYLAIPDTDICADDLGYFTYEQLPNYLDKLSPIGCYFGCHEGDGTLGYWQITMDNGLEELIEESPAFVKMIFIAENDHSKVFGQLTGDLDSLDVYCIAIAENGPKFTFVDALKKFNNLYIGYDKRDDMADYICENEKLLNWIIERVFWSDYKAQIDRLIGNQDITRLFLDITSQHAVIDGIDCDDVWSLRESCDDCEDLDLDYDDMDDLECGCVGYDGLNNVWIVTESRFYYELRDNGAMVYETGSLYLYLQTTHAGNYYDMHLRHAWLQYGAVSWLGVLT